MENNMPYAILTFFGIFTAVSLPAYAIAPAKYRHIVLLLISLICAGYFSPYGLLFMLITIFTTYLAGICMDEITKRNDTKGLEKQFRKQIKEKIKRKKKLIVFCYIIINLGILFVLKYFKMFFSFDIVPTAVKMVFPLGLSYYTLQSLSYVIDVFRGKYQAERNLLKLGLFISCFPQLHEGPFGRYNLLMPQMCRNEQIKKENVFSGVGQILWGLFKIFMVANRAAIISDEVFSHYVRYGGVTIVLGAVAFTLQLYAEFSGYIDVAAGISKIFGIKLTQNFDLPFIARDVAEFWRRWHISLGSWFRDYVFYPVSTSRWLRNLTKKMKMALGDFTTLTVSLLTVWFLTGLWHGASIKYICYGLYYFILMILLHKVSPVFSKLFEKLKINKESKLVILLQILKTQFFVLIGMLMFRANNLEDFLSMMKNIFRSGETFPFLKVLEMPEWIVLLLSMIVVIVSAVIKMKHINLEKLFNNLTTYQKYAVCFGACCIIIVFGAYGLDYLPPDPIYGGF